MSDVRAEEAQPLMGRNTRKGYVAGRFIARMRKKKNPFLEVEGSALLRYQKELRSELTELQAASSRISFLLSLLEEALNMQKMMSEGGVIRVTDHAVVRYLERYEGLDLSRVEAELIHMLEEGRPEIAFREGVIATVLPEGIVSLEHLADEGKL